MIENDSLHFVFVFCISAYAKVKYGFCDK